MNDIVGYIKTTKRIYPICFNLNVIEEIQELYGSITAWGEIVESKTKDGINIKDLKKGLTIMMNEAIDMENAELPIEQQQELVNEKQVGRIISEVGFEETTKIIMGLSKESTETEESSKNV